MNLDDLSESAQFAFIAMLQTAIRFKEGGKNKKFFVDFASEIWETMELSDIEYLKKVLMDRMMKDIKTFGGTLGNGEK